jgi:hypothetical protein
MLDISPSFYTNLFFLLAVLKLNDDDFSTRCFGMEGVKSSKMHTHFLLAV